MGYVPTGGSGGASIGGSVSGATAGSVFFAGAAGVLAQNNTAFKWVDADTQLQLTAGGATKTPLLLTLAGSQSADAFQVKNSGGTTLFAINATGTKLTGAQDFGLQSGAGAGGNPQWVLQSTYENGSFVGGTEQRLGWNSTVNGGNGGGTDTAIGRKSAGVMQLDGGYGGTIRGLMGGGTSVASASALPLPTGRVFHVTGTTTITSITSTNFGNGVVITLIFDGSLTVTDGSNLKLAGDFTATADDTLTLAYDGTNWFEVSRSIN